MKKMIRFECVRCIHKEHNAVSCAARDLRWALYHLMLTLPILRHIAKRPEHCPIDSLLLLAGVTSFGEHLLLSVSVTPASSITAAWMRVEEDIMRRWSYDQKEIHQVAHGCAIPAQ